MVHMLNLEKEAFNALGHLVSVLDSTTDTWIQTLLGSTTPYFIGLQRPTSGCNAPNSTFSCMLDWYT